MNKIYFITGNEKKFFEAKRVIPNLEMLNIDLEELQEIDSRKIIEAKLKSAMQHRTGEFVVEDVGLYMDALGGKLPGPLIKWFLNTIGNKGMYEIAKRFDNYECEVRATIGYAKNEKETYFFEGIVKGKIVEPVSPAKFGWDPLFCPDGYKKTFADMSPEEKISVSMRGIAFRKLQEFLEKS